MSLESFCAACTYMSERTDYTGKYWCSRKGEYIFACDGRCSSFCEAYSRSNSSRENMYDNSYNHRGNCYLTTIMCEILGYDDRNYYLNTLRSFRDNVMKANPRYATLLLTYDLVGPMIAYQLNRDKHKKEISRAIFDNYIVKSVDAIECEKYDTAINIYMAMTGELAKKYNINTDIIMPSLDEIDKKYLGHGKIRKLVNN